MPNHKLTALTKLIIGLVIVSVILSSLIFFSYQTSQKLYGNFGIVEHTYHVTHSIESILSEVSDCESMARAYVISGENSFLNKYKSSRDSLWKEYNYFIKLISDNPQQQKNSRYLDMFLKQRFVLLDSTILMRSLKNEVVYNEILIKGDAVKDSIEYMIQIMKDEESHLLKLRQDEAYENLNISNNSIGIAGVSAIVIIVIVVFVIWKDIQQRIIINKQLTELDVNKNKFFSIISHDLRGPAYGVHKLAEILEDETKDNPQVQEISKLIVKSSQKVIALMENLLQWAKTQMGTVQINKIYFPLSQVVDQVKENVSNSAALKNISIDINIRDTEVYADPNMISLVIRNIMSNAIKFTSKDGSITLNTFSNEKYIRLSVEDTGTGMEPGQVKKLFNVSETTSYRGTEGEVGSGLGLSLSKEFMLKNDGDISVESTPGKGSKFYIDIPVRK